MTDFDMVKETLEGLERDLFTEVGSGPYTPGPEVVASLAALARISAGVDALVSQRDEAETQVQRLTDLLEGDGTAVADLRVEVQRLTEERDSFNEDATEQAMKVSDLRDRIATLEAAMREIAAALRHGGNRVAALRHTLEQR